MSSITPQDVRLFLTDHLKNRLMGNGQALNHELSDDLDMLLSGIIDSLGLLQLISAITENYNKEINFEELDPENMTIIGPFCEFVSQQLNQP